MLMGHPTPFSRRMARSARVVALTAAAVLLVSHLHAEGDAANARLLGVYARTDGHATAVVIETSEPIAYVTTRPDPLTLLVDLRNVSPVQLPKAADMLKGPVIAMSVAPTTAPDGAPVARVTLTLAKPGTPSVRSKWNMVVVEFGARIEDAALGKPAPGGSPASAAAPGQKPAQPAAATPASAAPKSETPKPVVLPAITGAVGTLTGVESSMGPDGMRVKFVGTGTITPGSIQPIRELPPRLVIDFPSVVSTLPPVTLVGKGPVDKIRVALNSRQPLVTRAVIDLRYPVGYKIESSEGGLSILLDPTPIAPAAAPADLKPAPAEPKPATTPEPKAEPKLATTPEPKAESKPAAQAPVPAVAPAAPAPPAPPAPVQAQTAAAQVEQAGRGDKKYTGHLVTFDFQQADLRAVLRTFSDISGLNVVIDPTVNGTVDVSLKEVPWDQALEIILRANKLGYLIENNVVRIAPLTALADEEAQRQKRRPTAASSRCSPSHSATRRPPTCSSCC